MAMFTLGLVFVGCALRLRRKLSVRAAMYRSHVHNYRKTNWKFPLTGHSHTRRVSAPYSFSCRMVTSEISLSGVVITFSNMGEQQTWQSSTYCCSGTEQSIRMVMDSPQ